jgi:hypothetical protein
MYIRLSGCYFVLTESGGMGGSLTGSSITFFNIISMALSSCGLCPFAESIGDVLMIQSGVTPSFSEGVTPRAIVSARFCCEVPIHILQTMAKGIQSFTYGFRYMEKNLDFGSIIEPICDFKKIMREKPDSLFHFRGHLWETCTIEKIKSKYDNVFALNI